MPIEIKHSGNVAPTLVGAYGGGMGQGQLDQARLALQFFSQNRALSSRVAEAEKDRLFSAEQAELGQERALERMAKEEEYRGTAAERDLGRMETQFGFESRLAGDAFSRSMEADRLRRWREEPADLNLEYSPRQREEFNTLSDSYEEAVSSGEFTEDELADVRRQILAKQMGITPQPRMKKKSPWPEGRGAGDTWTTDEGVLLTRDEKGNVKKLGETASAEVPSIKDVSSVYDQAVKVLTKETAEGLKTLPNPEEIEAYVKSVLDLREKMIKGELGKPAEEGGAAPESTETGAGEKLPGSDLTPEQIEAEIQAKAAEKGIDPEIIREMYDQARTA